jgi:hypothetical protein
MRMKYGSRLAPARERGAVLAMTCVIVTTCLAAAAFAIDLGHLWSSQRRVRNSSDAAALAAAQEFALQRNGCDGEDDAYAVANDAGASVTDCHDHPNGDSGYVTVATKRPVDYQFAGVMGVGGNDVKSTTHAVYGLPSGGFGLRPMGLCLQANPELTAWLNLPQGPTGDSGDITISYTKDHPDACGSNVPGNWGMLDFNGGSQSNSETKEWVLNGYNDLVRLDGPPIPGDTGSFNPSIDDELATLVNDEFTLPIFISVSGTGSNAQFTLGALVRVKLKDYRTNGAESARFIQVQFKRGYVQGTCCGNGVDAGARSWKVCSVDATEHPRSCSSPSS